MLADLSRVGLSRCGATGSPRISNSASRLIGNVVYAGGESGTALRHRALERAGRRSGAAAARSATSIRRSNGVQVKVSGMTDPRYVVTCNGRRVPLHPTGVRGEAVAGVRYRAWQPPNCLHPTIGVHAPLVFDVFDTWNRPLDRRLHLARGASGRPALRNVPGQRQRSRKPPRRPASSALATRRGQCSESPAAEVNRDFPLTLDLRRPDRVEYGDETAPSQQRLGQPVDASAARFSMHLLSNRARSTVSCSGALLGGRR